MRSDDPVELLNAVSCLYLREISEPRPGSNTLRIVVDEAKRPSLATTGDTKKVAQWAPIQPTEGCKAFELYWKHYFAYLVTEECSGSCGKYEDETYTGKILREYSRSHFRDHLARDTGGHFAPLRHYKLICLDHLIDIASPEPPAVSIVQVNLPS
jgi:hypothetical protein